MGPTAKGLQSLVSSTSRVDSSVLSLQPQGPRQQQADVPTGVPGDAASPSASLRHHTAGGYVAVGVSFVNGALSSVINFLSNVNTPVCFTVLFKESDTALAAPDLSQGSSSAGATQDPVRGRVEGPGESELQHGCPDLEARKRAGLCVRLRSIPQTRARLFSLIETRERGED